MKLKENAVGQVITKRLENGYTVTVTIEDNKKLFKYYKQLGLDVFEPRKKRESTESNNEQ